MITETFLYKIDFSIILLVHTNQHKLSNEPNLWTKDVKFIYNGRSALI